MNKYAAMGIALLVVGALGYGTGRYLQPANVKIQEKEVVKEVEVVKKDIVVVERTITRPDGTVETERRTEDRSTERSNRTSDSSTSTVITATKPQWRAQALAGLKLGVNQPMIYGAGVERRILGPIFVGVQANTDKFVGVTASWEF